MIFSVHFYYYTNYYTTEEWHLIMAWIDKNNSLTSQPPFSSHKNTLDNKMSPLYLSVCQVEDTDGQTSNVGPLQTSVDVKITRSPRLAFVVRNIETSRIQCQFDKVRELRTKPFLSKDSSLSCNVCINDRSFPVREIFVSNNL